MRTRLRPNLCDLGRPRLGGAANSKRTTACRAVAGVIGLFALAVLAASCLPVGKASTSTYASLPVEEVPAVDSGATSAGPGIAVAASRGASPISGIVAAVASPEDRSASGSALADVNSEQRPSKQAALSPPETRVWLVADGEQATQLAALGYQDGERLIVASGDLRALPPETQKSDLQRF